MDFVFLLQVHAYAKPVEIELPDCCSLFTLTSQFRQICSLVS